FRALTECGTLKDDKNAYKNKLDKVSAFVGGNTGMDFATFRMNCIKGDFDVVWPLYVEAMTIPKFDTKEFARIRQDAINEIRAEESDPNGSLFNMARQTAFNGKPYAKNPAGTVATVTALTATDTKNYFKSIFTRGRMFIVVVGDIERTVLEQKLKEFIAKVPQGVPFVPKKDTYTPAANSFKAQQKENATNYIMGITGAPLPGTTDYDAFTLAMDIFYNKHFLEIRSNRGLSYAPAAFLSRGLAPFAALYVSTTEPNKYIAAARALIDTIKMKGFTDDELKDDKAYFVNNMYYRQETNSAQASAFVSNEVLNNNWRKALTVKEDLGKVSVTDLNRVFKQYINNITWVYQGDPKKVDSKMYTQKETPPHPKETKAF
ncbi:MAG TPA: pitrilysin family protein, partial [Chitinophagaceae bacterium]|nr:pitrilysin family protein [Chitinophagaceae bacterium]